MKKTGTKLLSVFLAFVMLLALLPTFTLPAKADEEFYTTCEVCGETMTLDEWGDYHAAGDCWFCGDCYGLVTQCPNCGLHLCEETHCEENGHCLDDVNGAECPFDVPCDDFDDGHCPLCCQEAYDNTGHECGICPYSSEWEDHFCQDDGCCYKECADAAGIQADSPDDIYCPDCGHCYRYSWDYADHECDVHDCPCQCTLCPDCGNCIESSYCTPCEDCGAECNCECVYCDYCGMCLNSDDHEVCDDCGKCSEEWVPCPYCDRECNCTCEA